AGSLFFPQFGSHAFCPTKQTKLTLNLISNSRQNIKFPSILTLALAASASIYLNHQLKIKSPISDKRLLLNRLDVRMLKVSLHESGWDGFMLKYKTERPLDLTLSVAAMQNYLRMLWWPKR
ncbi:hypothetical protein PTTG_30697, partial [Puccinia triticina 1-1 BBBD Race 1]